jgi:hypothetical protein
MIKGGSGKPIFRQLSAETRFMIVAAEQKTSLHEIAFCEFLARRSNGTQADEALTQALTACLRAGGFGILLASQLVDDLVYNERHNEVQFVKYLS